MTAVFILVGIMASVYFWRLLWFVFGALAVPTLTGLAWCLGALAGLPGRLLGQTKMDAAPQVSRSDAIQRPSAEVIDLAAEKRSRNRP
jgi:hypothetical protein